MQSLLTGRKSPWELPRGLPLLTALMLEGVMAAILVMVIARVKLPQQQLARPAMVTLQPALHSTNHSVSAPSAAQGAATRPPAEPAHAPTHRPTARPNPTSRPKPASAGKKTTRQHVRSSREAAKQQKPARKPAPRRPQAAPQSTSKPAHGRKQAPAAKSSFPSRPAPLSGERKTSPPDAKSSHEATVKRRPEAKSKPRRRESAPANEKSAESASGAQAKAPSRDRAEHQRALKASFAAALRAAVRNAARYPRAALMMGIQGTAQVVFDYRDGEVSHVELIRSSGYQTLDRAALTAVRRANVPAPPPALAGSEWHFRIPVHFGRGG